MAAGNWACPERLNGHTFFRLGTSCHWGKQTELVWKLLEKVTQNKGSIWQLLLRAEWNKQKSLLSKHESSLIDAIKVKLNKEGFSPKFKENFSQGCHWNSHLGLLNKRDAQDVGNWPIWPLGADQTECANVDSRVRPKIGWLANLGIGEWKAGD